MEIKEVKRTIDRSVPVCTDYLTLLEDVIFFSGLTFGTPSEDTEKGTHCLGLSCPNTCALGFFASSKKYAVVFTAINYHDSQTILSSLSYDTVDVLLTMV